MIYWLKICIFLQFLSTPVLFVAVTRGFTWDLGYESNGSPGLSGGENCMILWSLVLSQYQRVIDTRTAKL